MEANPKSIDYATGTQSGRRRSYRPEQVDHFIRLAENFGDQPAFDFWTAYRAVK